MTEISKTVSIRAEITEENVDDAPIIQKRKWRHYKCDVCGVTCSDIKSLSRHGRKHTTSSEIKCSLCEKTFTERRLLTVHYPRHHTHVELSKIGIVYFCSKCDLGYPTREELIEHEKNHVCREKTSLPCTICGKTFQRMYNLKMHKMIHTGEKPFVCDKCGVGFVAGSLLKKHKAKHTGDKEKYIRTCDECGKTFESNSGLSNHYTQKHAGVNFPCEICGRILSTKLHLQKHKLIHAKNKSNQNSEVILPDDFNPDLETLDEKSSVEVATKKLKLRPLLPKLPGICPTNVSSNIIIIQYVDSNTAQNSKQTNTCSLTLKEKCS